MPGMSRSKPLYALALMTFGARGGQLNSRARRRARWRNFADALVLAGVVLGVLLWFMLALLTAPQRA